MFITGTLPWLDDPLQGTYSGWKLPVDIGWQFHTPWINYGLLCTLCALLAFLTAGVHLFSKKRGKDFAQWYDKNISRWHALLGALCTVPFFFFMVQYLFADLHGMDLLTQDTTQALFIQQHLGYALPSLLIPLVPLKFSSATFLERLTLLANTAVPSIFLTLISGYLLTSLRPYHEEPEPATEEERERAKRKRSILIGLGVFVLLVVFGRAPAAIICLNAAKASLGGGDDITALKWLHAATVFNPALNDVPYYHVYLGEAYYTLNSNVESDDSRIFLAFEYRSQGDLLDAEQKINILWHAHPTAPWVVSEASTLYETLAEFNQTAGGQPLQRAANDVSSMTWLQLLSEVDPSNVYSQYMLGRFRYYLHGYDSCITQMYKVIRLSHSEDIQSNAYAYIGLSVAQEGNIAQARI
ncbi:MAG: hypothetical protein JOZ18_07325, partial [Chloroflexi bacterium]|nr:hypothetical protein [Chloroflexota bacterium]